MERFDNITDEEIEEGIQKINKRNAKNPRIRKLVWGLIVTALILILVIGYDVAPNYSLDKGEYLLKWLRG